LKTSYHVPAQDQFFVDMLLQREDSKISVAVWQGLKEEGSENFFTFRNSLAINQF